MIKDCKTLVADIFDLSQTNFVLALSSVKSITYSKLEDGRTARSFGEVVQMQQKCDRMRMTKDCKSLVADIFDLSQTNFVLALSSVKSIT